MKMKVKEEKRMREVPKITTDFERWEKIEDWFDNIMIEKWEHCYACFDVEGKLWHVQSSGRNYCQGAHYLQSGYYSWGGKTKLDWRYDEELKKGILTFPNGLIAKRWAGYSAVILFRTKSKFDHERGRWTNIWDGKSSPLLLFKRERANKRRFEKGGRLFNHSPFVLGNEGTKIAVPDDFLHVANIYFDSLLDYLEKLK